MREQQVNKDATIYNYRLLKRLRYPMMYTYVYIGLLGALYAADLFRMDPVRLPACFAFVAASHYGVIRLLFIMKEERAPQAWSLHLRLPWVCLIPDNYYSLNKLAKLHQQLFWVPMILLTCLYPWVSSLTMLYLLVSHLWLALPRILVFYLFRKHIQSALIKISAQDTSCYAQ
ncbi:hypothetical protein [Paenibacillus thalictri]|uniref:Uncharacterized protein n=1 Tax=Paenibacillus thalictri TaxID=2527873 RepID=A0A4Q9DFA6_9BACL|nr:hypothetical protein [Paenibacillus thalictri]TBL68995.1 hypothetical protein EYB31_37130 [Paenibacillus thalictri]